MTVVQTVLVYAGIPALVIGILAVLTVGRPRKNVGRYTLGEPWTAAAVWFEGHPRPGSSSGGPSSTRAIEAGLSNEDSVETLKGGASGSW